ncbi:hypothetical protein LCGC14_3065310 [marine sediment metagenome]|uniref:Uncharacterized protein n=1 Tax=marine sediment metagenome TaxID=412755 RepID=A0A0F8Z8G6_9ZZZZ
MTDKEYIEKAREQYARDGEIEIDDVADVARDLSDEPVQGAYVQAWVWVTNDEEGEED